MRIRPRLKTMVPMLLTLALSAESSAQMMDYPSYGAPAFMGGPPPAYSAVNTSGMPGSFQAYPNISPYENAMDQHYNTDGMWFRKILPHSMATNDYFFNISYVRTKARNLSGRVGDINAPTFTQEETIDGTTNTNLPDALFLNNFNPASASLPPDVIGNGIQINWGMKSQFGWGMSVEGMWNAPSAQIYNARQNYEQQRLQTAAALDLEASNGEGAFGGEFSQRSSLIERQIVENDILTGPILTNLADDFGLFGGADDVLDRQLFNLHAIPLQNGVDFDGFNQRFDMDFILKHSIETYTGAVNFSAPVVYETDSLKIHPVIGGRFLQINEGYSFRGVDSGLVYLQNIPDGVDDDDDFVVDNVAETGTATFTQGNPSTDSIIRSFVDASVQSQMGGPEIGIQYTLGEGKGITINGATKVGALFNSEKMRLSGDNIGDTVTTNIDLVTGETTLLDMFDTTTRDPITGRSISTLNAFNEGKRTTHVSPMFQQSLMAEIPLFSRVPVLRDMWQFQNASFTAGWTFLYVGEVADPQQSINWLSNPRAGVTPTIDIERSTYFQNSFSAGINWEY